MHEQLIAIQKILFPNSPEEWDGKWGKRCIAALGALTAPPPHPESTFFVGKASSFADPADVRSWLKWTDIYIGEGMSRHDAERKALSKGDNGVGCWDDNTKTGSGPCCAVPVPRLIEKWGSKDAAKHKLIAITIGGITHTMPLKDVQTAGLASGAVIDINPDGAELFSLRPPFLVPASWNWA